MKKGVLFLYFSLLVHVYVLLMAEWWLDPEIIRLLRFPKRDIPQEITVEHILIDNPHATREKPVSRPKLSDVDSRSRGSVASQEEYNMLFPESSFSFAADHQPLEGEVSSSERRIMGGPSLYAPEKKPVVRMSSAGQIALESEAVDYALYFKHIQQTVASNWQLYFPIFQYYRGILADGVVAVTFDLDNDGNLRNVRLTRDFGYDSLNDASLRAIQHTSNYGPLPEKLRSPEGITVEFHFIYIRP